MIELAPRVYHVPGDNRSRFPYCSCLYLKGRETRVLIDAGMGRKNMEAVNDSGLDLIILSHCHLDHRLTRPFLPPTPVWCHELETSYIADRPTFLEAVGFIRGGFDGNPLWKRPMDVEVVAQATLTNGQRIDLGGLSLEVIHTPGHTPGHLAFFIPEVGLLFTADVDLSSFGPFYGHDFAVIDDFARSIARLKTVPAKTILSGHAGPFSNNLKDRFDAYLAIIDRRDQIILGELSAPRSIESLVGRNLIYSQYKEPSELIRWFERVHIEKHLERLQAKGLARQTGGCWERL